MSTSPDPRRVRAQRGATLVELVVALVVLAVVMGTLWSAWALLARGSADPLVARQSLAVAQSLLREIELQPLPGSAIAAATPGRTGFASIADYHGLVLDGITDVEGTPVAGLETYRATVGVSASALGDATAADGWWISVRVEGPDGSALQLGQWRSRR